MRKLSNLSELSNLALSFDQQASIKGGTDFPKVMTLAYGLGEEDAFNDSSITPMPLINDNANFGNIMTTAYGLGEENSGTMPTPVPLPLANNVAKVAKKTPIRRPIIKVKTIAKRRQ